jgi:hypothetical protein
MDVLLTEDQSRFVCAWFALCDRPAEWVTRGPIGDGLFGEVPICQRCADKMGITELLSYSLTVEEAV